MSMDDHFSLEDPASPNADVLKHEAADRASLDFVEVLIGLVMVEAKPPTLLEATLTLARDFILKTLFYLKQCGILLLVGSKCFITFFEIF
jgi:hypothetical protein